MSLTLRLREELCGVPTTDAPARVAELSALLRFGGAWTMRDGGAGWVLDTGVPAVVRRAHRVLTEVCGVRPTVEAHEPGGLSATTRYRLRVSDVPALERLGLVDAAGHPLPSCPAWVRDGQETMVAYLRGALMAGGGVSGAGQAPHLEVRGPSEQAVEDLRGLLDALGAAHLRSGAHGESWRVVCKSGEEIGRVLALSGAHGTFLEFDEGRLRRQLRGEATRAANADRGNLRRAVAASARQVRSINGLLGSESWDDLPDELKEVALARLANPEASLTELARLLDSTRATVHRRLLRLEREGGRTVPGG